MFCRQYSTTAIFKFAYLDVQAKAVLRELEDSKLQGLDYPLSSLLALRTLCQVSTLSALECKWLFQGRLETCISAVHQGGKEGPSAF